MPGVSKPGWWTRLVGRQEWSEAKDAPATPAAPSTAEAREPTRDRPAPSPVRTPSVPSDRGFTVAGVRIDDSFAEAFPMSVTGVIITAPSAKWAEIAGTVMTGFATSVIGCGCEAGISAILPASDTPDGRPGVLVLVFGFDAKGLEKVIGDRVGQCVLTCPGTACYAAPLEGDAISMGRGLRYFGDGFQASKLIAGRRFWRVPVMDGEFVCEDTTRVAGGAVGGGNLLIMGPDFDPTLAATEAAVEAMRSVAGVIMPFPGGIVRSGSKVGSVYKFMSASTNHLYSPALRARVDTELDSDIGCVLEIVIDGVSAEAVAAAMKTGVAALLARGPAGGVLRIGAGNYGGKLGPHHFHLRDCLP